MNSQIKGKLFEEQCYKKLVELGFTDLFLTKPTDNGADIVGTFNETRYVIQCKNHNKAQGNKCVQEVVAAQKLYKGHRSVVISNSDFTPSAIQLAEANNCILIIASDFFGLDCFPPKNYSKSFQKVTHFDPDYSIIERYEEIKRNLGRIPKWAELDKTLQYRIRKEYKNYSNFTSSLGLPMYSRRYSEDELKEEYLRIRFLLNRVPTLSDIKEHSQFPINSFHEYPFTKLQKECGDRPNIERGVSKDELINAYFDLQKELGRFPIVKEIDQKGKYKASYYRRRWGSIDGFLQDIGISRTEAGLSRRYSKKEIMIIYFLIKILISFIRETDSYTITHTTLENLKFFNQAIISPTTISKKFNSWAGFVEYKDESGVDSIADKIIDMLRNNDIQSLVDYIQKR